MSMPSTTETVNPERGIPSYLDVFEQVGGSGGHAELQDVLRRLVARTFPGTERRAGRRVRCRGGSNSPASEMYG
jgi:hypothetical protein